MFPSLTATSISASRSPSFSSAKAPWPASFSLSCMVFMIFLFNCLSGKRGQPFFNLRPAAFVLRGQLEMCAEFAHGFIDGKPGVVGSQLEQYTAGFAEIKREEIIAIDL